MSNYPSRFVGDGRRVIEPNLDFVVHGTRPMSIRRSQARMLCDRFAEKLQSNHSGAGNVLWVVLEYCAHNDIPVTIQGRPGYGFEVRGPRPQPKAKIFKFRRLTVTLDPERTTNNGNL